MDGRKLGKSLEKIGESAKFACSIKLDIAYMSDVTLGKSRESCCDEFRL